MSQTQLSRASVLFALAWLTSPLMGDDSQLIEETRQAMRRAAEYYHREVASHGGYVYFYSPDLQRRMGEGMATRDQIWVQPPGTPTVGMAYLKAYAATNDRFYLDAAVETGEALMYGQLKSGGWQNCVDFDPRGERVALYRNGKGRGKDNSTLDDGISQAAIRFLMRLDEALDFKNQRVHESAKIALDALLNAQFDNGAFPQVWTEPVPKVGIVKASFPKYEWRTEGRIKEYWDMFTLNDGLAGTVAETLIDAQQIYGDERYIAALKRLGDFLILAQMPEPQPAWAQQYGYDMHPIWARKFEPPAVTGGESQDVVATLLEIYRQTGDEKYLTPIPSALAYLKRSLLDDGRLARYYELQSNRPLYMTRQGDVYSLTYDDSNLPDHYGWKIESRLEELANAHSSVRRDRTSDKPSSVGADATEVARIVRDLDDQGRWLSTYDGKRLVGQPKFQVGESYLSSAVFSENIETLAKFLIASNRSSD